MVSDHEFTARCAVTAPSGEESVLTITMQARGSPSKTRLTSFIQADGQGPHEATAQNAALQPAPSQQPTTSQQCDGCSAYETMRSDGHMVAAADGGDAYLHREAAATETADCGAWAVAGAEATSETAAWSPRWMDAAPVRRPSTLNELLPRQPDGVSDAASFLAATAHTRACGGSGSQHGGSDGRVWVLSRITGEPKHTALPVTPSPEFSPEAVVQSQVHALQELCIEQVRGAKLSPTHPTMMWQHLEAKHHIQNYDHSRAV